MNPEELKIKREEIRSLLKCREGTISRVCSSDQLLNREMRGGILFDCVSDCHLIRVIRTDELILQYFHFSPGHGSRVAEVDLGSLHASNCIFITVTWTPEEIMLSVYSLNGGDEMQMAKGCPSPKSFRVGTDGGIYQVGDVGVETFGVQIIRGDVPILVPTAMESWRKTIAAAKILCSGTSEEGYMFEVAISNSVLVTLVTGFEVYLRSRFIEMELEGRKPRLQAILDEILTRKEKESGYIKVLLDAAADSNMPPLRYVVERRRVNFQSYTDAKAAYNKAYGLKFGELASSQLLENVQRYFDYRHKIVHFEPMCAVLDLNGEGGQPVCPSKALAESALEKFDELIGHIHQASLLVYCE